MTVPAIAGSIVAARDRAVDAPLIVLGPSLGTTAALWADVEGLLAANFRVLRYDLPGHGASPAAIASFEVGDIADGVLALVDQLQGGSFFYAGDSLGSAVGLELASRHPNRVLGLVVFCGGATFGTPQGWHDRAALVRADGTAAVRELSAARWFSPGFIRTEPARAASVLDQLNEVDAESYSLCCDALAIFDFGATAAAMRVPTTVVSGEFDVASPPATGRALANLVPGADYVLMPGAGHVPVFEQPAESERILRSALQQRVS